MVRVAQVAFAGVALVTAAAAQDVLSIPVHADGELHPPEGSVVEPTFLVSTFAGTGEARYSGDGGQATAAQFTLPGDLAADGAGNLYVSDFHLVRRIDSTGVITSLAQLSYLLAVSADETGNVYVMVALDHWIRRTDKPGVIATIADTGERGDSGDGDIASRATLAFSSDLVASSGLAADANGNIYVADMDDHRIRFLVPGHSISVQLGSSQERVAVAVRADGVLTRDGSLLLSGSRVTATLTP